MKYLIGIVVSALLIAGAWTITTNDNQADTDIRADETFAITTSFYPLEYALERITGDLAKVTNIGEGRDPHDFRPSTQDVLALQRSDLVVIQGVDFEPWGDDIKESLEADGIKVVLATKGLKLREGGHAHDDENHEDEHNEESTHEEDEHDDSEHEDKHHDEEHAHDDEHAHEEDHHDEHEHGAYDPHTWVDPVLFSQTVDTLTKEIIALDETNANTYRQNAETFKADLAAIDKQYETRLASCPLDEVITSHEAFGYVGKRYNFEIHSIAGLSTQDTPSATTLALLREEAEEGIGAILLEENSITAYGDTLARETGLQTLSINPIAYIIPEGEDFLSLMLLNLDTFATALNCNE